MHSSRAGAYYKYYVSQAGGEFPVFRGGQHGAGLGDIFRTIFRWIAPIAVRGLTTFATNTMKSYDQGSSFKEAAKGALAPTLGALRDAVTAKFQPPEQSGSGTSALFSGDAGVPYAHAGYKRVHFGGGKKHKKSAKRHKAQHSVHTTPATNF